MTQNGLAGQSKYMSAPSGASGLIGGTLAVFYGFLTVDLPLGTRLPFVLIAVAIVLSFTKVGNVLEQAVMLRTLRGLSLGALKPTTVNLLAAVQETFSFPNRSYFVTVSFWAVGASLCGGLYSLLPQVTWAEQGGRIAGIGLALGPIIATLLYLLQIVRTRQVVSRLSEAGLSLQEVIAAHPPSRRQFRLKLLAFTAVVALTPSLMVMDLWRVYLHSSLEKLVLVPNAADRATMALSLQAQGGWSLPAFIALVAALGLYIAYLAGSSLSAPLRAITHEAGRIASGDLRGVKLVPAEDEVWAAWAALIDLQQGLSSALFRLHHAALKLGGSTGSLHVASETQKAGADEQMASLNETSATTEELASSGAQIAENSSQVAQMAQRTVDAAKLGQQSCQAFTASVDHLRLEHDRIGAAVARLNKRVQQIGQVVEFIQGIGDKADLLSLNAELEGTKAGEVGRGFKLVAAEMRRLAESVVASAQEIVGLITEIRDRANAAVMATESGIKAMHTSAGLSEKLTSSLSTILTLAYRTWDAARSISVATQQQQTSTDQLAQTMAEILRVTVESQAGGALRSHHLALTSLADTLQRDVSAFQLQTELTRG